MEKREDRRDRDFRYGARARTVHLRFVHPDGVVDCICERSAWFFRKSKALGCRGSKKGASGTSKRGSCCKGGCELRHTVHLRHDGRRICRAWESWLREREADDFDEGRLMKWRER